jgi:hypothetical protein
MNIIGFIAKTILAVILLTAGGSKAASLRGFGVVIRLFLPRRLRHLAATPVALAVVATELALGAASFLIPSLRFLNWLVLCLCCAFLVISAVGYAYHRDVTCQCFGALSRRQFDGIGVARSAGLVGLALVAALNMRPVDMQLSISSQVLLAFCVCLVTGAAFVAARVLENSARNLRRV